ncbi:MAG: signal peptide peptidase SppA [Woeseia sp.]|nr:signal peptide peptidase SppA [Woeseia sp.]
MFKRGWIGRFFHAIWRGADGLRKVLHLLVLLFLFSIVLAIFSAGTPKIPETGALLIQPQGTLVEQLAGDPFERGIAELTGDLPAQTLVTDVLDGLDFAADDERITTVVLDLRGFGGAGMSTLQRVAAAMLKFRESDKAIIAHGDYFSQGAYFLAAHADEVYMHPRGLLLLPGFGAYRNYYKDAIDKLKIDWNVFRAGAYKSGVEPYVRNSMSDEDRSSISRVIERLWNSYREGIAAARQIPADSADRLIGEFATLVEQADVSASDVAVNLDFVDELLTRQELVTRIVGQVGADDDSPLGFTAISLDDYIAHMRLTAGLSDQKQNVAIVVASGEILDGRQSPGKVGGESTSELLARARKDEAVSAVVLRIDSPGGSAFASELIRGEVLALQAAGKPVVASMGDVAASGGYWIAMSTDQIFATESTITGSIGVYRLFPTFERTLETIGVHTDGVGTSVIAGSLRLDRTLNADARRIVQAMTDDDYEHFVSLVAAGRGLDVDSVQRIAQGQIWIGREALDNGLVDELGNLDAAIRAAAALAGLEEDSYGKRLFEKELSPAELFTLQFMGGAKALGLQPGWLRGGGTSLERVAGHVETLLAPLTRFNDPRGSYAHCFCDFSPVLTR